MVVGHPLAIYHPSAPPRWPNTAPTACVPRTPVCPAALPVTLRAGHVTRPKRLPLRATAGAATAARPVMIHHDDPRPPANRCSTHSAVQVRPARLQRCQRGLLRALLRALLRCGGASGLAGDGPDVWLFVVASWPTVHRWMCGNPANATALLAGVGGSSAALKMDQSSSVQTYDMER